MSQGSFTGALQLRAASVGVSLFSVMRYIPCQAEAKEHPVFFSPQPVLFFSLGPATCFFFPSACFFFPSACFSLPSLFGLCPALLVPPCSFACPFLPCVASLLEKWPQRCSLASPSCHFFVVICLRGSYGLPMLRCVEQVVHVPGVIQLDYQTDRKEQPDRFL